jgi:hypothetical protein
MDGRSSNNCESIRLDEVFSIAGEFSGLADAVSTAKAITDKGATAIAEAFEPLQDSITDLAALTSNLVAAFAGVDWDAIADAMQEHEATIDSILESAVNFGPLDREQLYGLLRTLGMTAGGLGLTESQFEHIRWNEFVEACRNWKRSRGIKGERGRKKELLTTQLHNAWVEMGKPKRRADFLVQLAQKFFPKEFPKTINRTRKTAQIKRLCDRIWYRISAEEQRQSAKKFNS